MKNWKKALSLILAVLMVASAVSIGAILAYHLPMKEEARLGDDIIIITEETKTEPEQESAKDEPIADADDKNPVPDYEPYVPSENESVSAGNMSAEPETEPAKEPEDKSEFFDENNGIKIPFDEIYEEEFEEGAFAYDDETLMIKVKSLSSEREKALGEAGILKLEEMMILEDSAWYVAYIAEGGDITDVMEKVRALDFIKVAEYNFEYQTTASIIDSTELSGNVTGNASVNDQWYLKSCGVQSGWKYLQKNNLPVAGEGVVVAVIDTGVDYDHIDLAANMWKNTAEIPDNGKDDDGNGYVDDYYGVDVVDKKGNGDDDHGHGTHVAGIIAAVNNKEGIAGIAYNAKIMAVKAGNASGYFLQSDVAKAILYAYENGAEVINMSFGGSASSVAVQDALAVAYSRCVLIAAAGNDGLPNEYVPGIPDYMPTYPGALGYVLGVMAVDQYGRETSFTNWDVKGFNGVEYEMYAPGAQMISTIPNNNYATWSGTSMAAPVASAIAANLRGAFGDRTVYPTKFIYGQLASTSEIEALCLNLEKHGDHNIPQVADMYSALTKLPKPEVDVIDFAIFDTEKYSASNNGDGVIDSGETFELGFTLKNKWGKAENAIVTVDSVSEGGVANPYVTFGNDTVNYGEVGTYSEKNAGKIFENDMHIGWNAPFMVTVSNECPNDYILTINYTIRYENGLDENDDTVYETEGSIEVVVRRGTLVPNDISEDMTLTADKLWIVPYSVLVREGVTLTVEAGTNIQFYAASAEDPYAEADNPYIRVKGELLFKGTAEKPISIFPSERCSTHRVQIYEVDNGYINMEFCNVINPYLYDSSYNDSAITKVYGGEFSQNVEGDLHYKYSGRVSKCGAKIDSESIDSCAFTNVGNGEKILGKDTLITDCIFDRCNLTLSGGVYQLNIENCVFTGSNGYYGISSDNSIYVTSSTSNKYLNLTITNGEYKPYYDFLDFAGIEITCIETEEEYQKLKSVRGSGMIGLKYDDTTGEYRWINGAPVEDFIKDLIVEGPEEYGYLLTDYDKIYFTKAFYHNKEYLIEEEINYANDVNKEYIVKKWNEYQDPDGYNRYRNNVLVNNLNNDIKDWFLVKTLKEDENSTLNLNKNYWGTTNLELIEKQITDFDDDVSLAQINPSGFLTEAPSNVWPFVVNAGTIVDGIENIVMGEGEVKFFVEFNRDMDTSIPLSVSYGSTEPYADYTVEGEFVSPRRWEGSAYVSTLIEGGTQYFSIGNGKAADSFQKLYTDAGRFTFEIDMTEALAMNLQATAEDTHIHLEWFQDDFDTLMGYNVYRSTEEDGLYTKLNDVIIPADVTTFDDYEIEPGVVYYYNFTVVKTDLTESVPSGKQSLMSKDTMAPDMYHTPVYNAFTGNSLVITATVTDNVMVDSVKLYYRTAGADGWKNLEMNKSNDKYSAIIPSADVTTAGIEYYIEAFDGISYTYKGSAEDPYFVTVQLAVDDNDKGDVDGDGVITNKDALILLQGINDLYNLSAEEFARADINGDGVLNAVEALRILQYVSGKITSVLFD